MFKTSLSNADEFTITYELVPGQGSGGKRLDRLLEFAEKAKMDGRIKALSVTDNPGGNPALAPVAIGSELLQIGIEPLIHFSLKDKNRNQVESHIFLYQRLQMHSLLVLGGDFPKSGYYGQAKPVFDLDTIQTLQLMQDMENGGYRHRQNKEETDSGISPLFKGCVVSPFKTTESEQGWQYAKLLHKTRAGANYIITQLGFDMIKFQEMMTFCRQYSVDQPVLANIFIPSLAVARAMAAGKIPGVVVSKDLPAVMEKEAKQGDSQARLKRAASMISCIRKLGYQGVHIGGNGLSFADIRYVIDRVEKNTQKQHYNSKIHFQVNNSWSLYKPDQKGQKNISETTLLPGSRPGAVSLHLLAHQLLFSQQTFSGRLFKKFCLFCAESPARTRMLQTVEQGIKWLLFNCRMCGDCTLAGSTYLCPQSGCPKRLVNGPCGGSLHGFCEVFPEKHCFWVRVYDRLDHNVTITSLSSSPALPPKNWALEKTSSWINYFQKS
jgi:methylenetetrahydrofolate reductase (NADPH)